MARDYPAKRGVSRHPVNAGYERPKTSKQRAEEIRRELEASGTVLPEGADKPRLPGEMTGGTQV
jgi:hypothetical protein